MKLKLYLWLFMGLILITSCEEESSPVEVGGKPVIEKINMRENWNSNDSTLHKIEVTTIDPQGFSNIASVLFEVKNQTTSQTIFADSLFDDGAYYHKQDGDVIADDGVYCNRFSAAQMFSGLTDGEYIFQFSAKDKEGNESIPREFSVTLLDVGTDPVIESIKMKEKWRSKDTSLHKIEVKATDPQGFSNITSVLFEVKNQINGQIIFADSLFDDGSYYHSQDGDVTAGDGIFSNRFSSVQILSGSLDGEYIFFFQAFDAENNGSNLVEQTVIFNPNVQPEIVNVSAPDTLFSGTVGQIFQVAVFDSDGVEDVLRVYFESQKDGSASQIYEMDLFNTGNFADHGDLFADDSIHSMKLDSTFAASKIGTYFFLYYAEDSFNELNLIVPSPHIYIENKPGVIQDTDVPDATGRPADLQLTLVANDPQGLVDVDSVYFLLEKPDGTFGGNGLKFDLQDNGDPFYGDLIAGDGIYSKNISITDSNDPGIYIFHFYMRDKVGHLTSVTKDSITVY